MKSRKIWKTVLIALGCALGAWAFGALLLPVLLPFFIGLAVSLLAEKPVRLLQTRAHVPRSLASGLCVLLLFGLLFGVLFFLCRLLCAEAADLARQLPQLAENLAPLFEKLKSRLLALAERLPDGLGTGCARALRNSSRPARASARSSMKRSFPGRPASSGGCRTRCCSR